MVKKLFIFTFVMFVLSGCSGGSDAVDHSREYKSYEGIISTLPVPISGLDVTHALTTTEKSRIYLRSLVLNLDDYLDVEVRVFGDYYTENVMGNTVDILTVSSVDFLVEPVDLQDITRFNSSVIGIAFNYDANEYTVTETSNRVIIRSKNGVGTVQIMPFFKSPELDVNLKINRDNIEGSTTNSVINNFQVVQVASSSRLLYLFVDRDELFYEIKFENFVNSSDMQEFAASILNSMTFELYSIKSTPLEADVASENIAAGEISNVVELKEDVDNFSFKQVVERFGSRIRTMIPNYRSPISYSFTDNSHFYFVYYNNADERERILFRFDDQAFTEVARFSSGSSTDWNLVSGVNSVADRPLSVLIVEGGINRTVEVVQGYRYLESLPLGFGIQYPQSWYYSRVDDTYIFSDFPIESSNAKIKVELVRSSFNNSPGNIVSSNLKRQNSGSEIVYYAKVYDTYLKISGLSNYAEQLQTMANSVVELDL